MEKMEIKFFIVLIISIIIITSVCLYDESNKNNHRNNDVNNNVKNTTGSDIQIEISMFKKEYYMAFDSFSINYREYNLSKANITVNVTIKNISNQSIYISEGYKVGAGLWIKLVLPSNLTLKHDIYWSNADFDIIILKSGDKIEFSFNLTKIPNYNDYYYNFNQTGKHKIVVYSDYLGIESNQIEFNMIEKEN